MKKDRRTCNFTNVYLEKTTYGAATDVTGILILLK